MAATTQKEQDWIQPSWDVRWERVCDSLWRGKQVILNEAEPLQRRRRLMAC